MILGLGAGVARPRRRGARRLPSQQLRSSGGRSRGFAARDRAVALTFDDGPNPDATPAHSRRAQGARRERDVLHSRPTCRAVAGAREARRRRRTRDRQPRLLPPKAALQVARATFADDLDARDRRRSSARRACHPQLFRAPHGFRSPWVTSIARSLGQRTVGWSLGVWDSDRPGRRRHRRADGRRRAAGLDLAACTTATATILAAIECRRHRRCL